MLEFKDMSATYRHNRRNATIVKVWMRGHKSIAMEKYVCHNFEYLLEGDGPEGAEIAIKHTLRWLKSPHGVDYIKEAFDVDEVHLENFDRAWENTKQTFINHVLFRFENSSSVSHEILNKIRNGSEETPEIALDTFVGWLNTHVGRCFVRDAFGINIPTSAQDGSE